MEIIFSNPLTLIWIALWGYISYFLWKRKHEYFIVMFPLVASIFLTLLGINVIYAKAFGHGFMNSIINLIDYIFKMIA